MVIVKKAMGSLCNGTQPFLILTQIIFIKISCSSSQNFEHSIHSKTTKKSLHSQTLFCVYVDWLCVKNKGKTHTTNTTVLSAAFNENTPKSLHTILYNNAWAQTNKACMNSALPKCYLQTKHAWTVHLPSVTCRPFALIGTAGTSKQARPNKMQRIDR